MRFKGRVEHGALVLHFTLVIFLFFFFFFDFFVVAFRGSSETIPFLLNFTIFGFDSRSSGRDATLPDDRARRKGKRGEGARNKGELRRRKRRNAHNRRASLCRLRRATASRNRISPRRRRQWLAAGVVRVTIA